MKPKLPIIIAAVFALIALVLGVFVCLVVFGGMAIR